MSKENQQCIEIKLPSQKCQTTKNVSEQQNFFPQASFQSEEQISQKTFQKRSHQHQHDQNVLDKMLRKKVKSDAHIFDEQEVQNILQSFKIDIKNASSGLIIKNIQKVVNLLDLILQNSQALQFQQIQIATLRKTIRILLRKLKLVKCQEFYKQKQKQLSEKIVKIKHLTLNPDNYKQNQMRKYFQFKNKRCFEFTKTNQNPSQSQQFDRQLIESKYLQKTLIIKQSDHNSLNRWVFFIFNPTIELLKQNKNRLKQFTVDFNIDFSKHANIQFGIISSDSVSYKFNSLSAQRLSFHLRNAQVFDEPTQLTGGECNKSVNETPQQKYLQLQKQQLYKWQQNLKCHQHSKNQILMPQMSQGQNIQRQSKQQSHKWRNSHNKNLKGFDFIKNQQFKMQLIKQGQFWQIKWKIKNEVESAVISQQLIAKGFNFFVGMYHQKDQISINSF